MQTPENTPVRKGYNHLTLAERDRIQALLDAGVKPAEIARILGRDKTTIGREIQRNKRVRGDIPVLNTQQYQATAADHKAYVRRLYADYQGKKIHENPELERYVIRGLKAHWNPDEISGVMKREKQPFYASKTTIYEWLYSEWGQPYCRYLDSRQYKPRPRKPKAERYMIPDRVGIERRPQAVTDRTEYGHHEGDTVVSGKRTGSTAALVVDVERKARFISARKLANLKPQTFNKGMKSIQMKLVSVKSRTYDNGIENREHAKLGVDSYFCDPYSSWQKGGVENANRMIRHYLPKGMDLATVSPQKLARIVAILNNKPRKILGYKSALQVMSENGLLRQTATTFNEGEVALRG
ncbi:MAG TPA: IS30 family transposase [Candidatus Saccharimonadia bacterium]|nr:IS30 family transposase [Candidatus Saccharimonadia bacterium]